ncbi:hypothetical protein FRC01_012371 [Tulasnella sp. 417]|nr:hypothetical protein FRC01_012371 [Tulasnella sp. 417]
MMDDDFSFGNVWGDSSSPKASPAPLLTGPPKATSSTATAPAAAAASFDDFDDFADFNDAPTSTSTSTTQAPPAANGFAASGLEDDDFGDFGDFGDVPAAAGTTSSAFNQPHAAGFDDDDGFGNFGSTPSFQPPPPVLSIRTQRDWSPLQLDPLPRLSDLMELVDEILEPLWENLREDVFTDEPERQVEGPGQVLVTPERQHLITLGIPINLDEVLAPVAAAAPAPRSGRSTPVPSSLHNPPRPTSAPPTPRPGHPGVLANVSAVPGPRSATPKPSGLRNVAISSSGRSTPTPAGGVGLGNGIGSTMRDLGPAPQLDLSKIDEIHTTAPSITDAQRAPRHAPVTHGDDVVGLDALIAAARSTAARFGSVQCGYCGHDTKGNAEDEDGRRRESCEREEGKRAINDLHVESRSLKSGHLERGRGKAKSELKAPILIRSGARGR